jgi:hypothetical protein
MGVGVAIWKVRHVREQMDVASKTEDFRTAQTLIIFWSRLTWDYAVSLQ